MSIVGSQNYIPYFSDVLFITNYVKPANVLRTFLHLTLPLECPESIAINYDNGVTFRGATVDLENVSLEKVYDLVKTEKRKDDTFFSIGGAQTPFIKPTMSGSGLFFFGSDLLYNLPLVYSKSTLFSEDIQAISLLIHSCFGKSTAQNFLEKQLDYHGIKHELRNNLLEIKY